MPRGTLFNRYQLHALDKPRLTSTKGNSSKISSSTRLRPAWLLRSTCSLSFVQPRHVLILRHLECLYERTILLPRPYLLSGVGLPIQFSLPMTLLTNHDTWSVIFQIYIINAVRASRPQFNFQSMSVFSRPRIPELLLKIFYSHYLFNLHHCLHDLWRSVPYNGIRHYFHEIPPGGLSDWICLCHWSQPVHLSLLFKTSRSERDDRLSDVTERYA